MIYGVLDREKIFLNFVMENKLEKNDFVTPPSNTPQGSMYNIYWAQENKCCHFLN